MRQDDLKEKNEQTYSSNHPTQNSLPGKEINKFCPPQQRRPLPLLLYLSFFYSGHLQSCWVWDTVIRTLTKVFSSRKWQKKAIDVNTVDNLKYIDMKRQWKIYLCDAKRQWKMYYYEKTMENMLIWIDNGKYIIMTRQLKCIIMNRQWKMYYYD